MILSINVSAQRDKEHWFAPYFDSTNSTSYTHNLYFSTDSVTPFVVKIFSNNIEIGTVTISKNNPVAFPLPSQYIWTNLTNKAATVLNMGIYTQGTKPYFVSLRAAMNSHAEIITSKGRAGIGTHFYAAAAPITTASETYNFTTGILATEDNTVVTVSGYDPNIKLINYLTPIPSSITFSLNKGQSYMFAGRGDVLANKDGFIGAKIIATKPVSVINGNANSMYASLPSYGSDLIMDQSVPVERLGNEFAMVRSLSPITDIYDMEGGIIIATENNTQVFLNNATTPTVTLQEGEYYRILNNSYVQQGTSGHYNIYIKTTKNVYLYQLVGSGGGSASGGYNYIPPLNCFLPRKIDEIGLVNAMPGSIGTITLKLNIITEVGASVTVNGVSPNPSQGPFPLNGNANWVTYAIHGITGNLTITSTKAVTAGINGGYATAGYGGYFAGFSSIPLIVKQSGECVPGLVLEVDDSYETYQWYRNGALIPGATSNIHAPTLSGNYTVKISVGSCPPATTPIYKVFTCLKETTITKNLCDNSLNIIPEFSFSAQNPVPSTVHIISPPSNGIATLNAATGVIEYTPNPGFIGTDTIIYKFCGNDPEFTDCEQITLILTVSSNPVVYNATLRSCFLESNVATALFNLTNAAVTSQIGTIKKYYPSLTDAQNQTNEINPPSNYVAPNGIVYVRVSNTNGCYKIAEITLVVLPPVHSALLIDKEICIENKTTLDAGAGFDGYEWSTGATTQLISSVGVGTYWVKLRTGECITKQFVKVYATQQPVISNIEITNNKITVFPIGGTVPYQYSIDNIIWQDSNTFANLTRGDVTVYVRDSFECSPMEVTITIPNIINVITPNGDGMNDVLDYSALANKSNLIVEIFDRYGLKIHEGTKENGYKWNGTTNGGKKVSTGNYWFGISWNENKTKTPVKISGWILVKNRE